MKLPKEIIEKYEIEVRKEAVHIHSPSFINIYKDCEFIIEEDKTGYRIANSKVVVFLWKDHKQLHVSVFY